MCTEQILGGVPDERWDVYALGATLYHLLAGEPPYRDHDGRAIIEAALREPPQPLTTLARGAPRELIAIVERAMARDPRVRYADAVAVADELRAFQAGRLVAAHRYTWLERMRSRVRRHRAVAITVAVSLAVLLAFGAWSIRRVLVEQARVDTIQQREAEELRRAETFVTKQLDEYLELSRRVGAVAVAETPAQATEAMTALTAYADEHWEHSPALSRAVEQLAAEVTNGPRGRGSEATLGLAGLEVVRSVRFAWEETAFAMQNTASEPVKAMITRVERQRVVEPLLSRALDAGRSLRDVDPTRANVRAFWRYYWGELYFIESERLHGADVEAAMVHIGHKLDPSRPRESEINELEAAVREMRAPSGN
jgi:hypothetical protein